jgi:hypothetical protein
MTAREFDQWAAYYETSPWGPDRDNWHSAQISAILANVYRPKGAQERKPKDFMYESKNDRDSRETMQTLAALKAMAKPKK